jgi:hypothetical protein
MPCPVPSLGIRRGLKFSAAVALAFSPMCVWAGWSLETGARLSYTDNAFEFSGARGNATNEDPSQPAGIETRNVRDTIWEPTIEATRKWADQRLPTELSVKGHGFLYTDTPVLNHGNYRIQVKQWLDADTAVLLRYRYTPNLLLGANIERRSGASAVLDEKVTSHQWRAELEREMSRDWTAALIGRYGLRFYNDAFAERDTHFMTLGSRAAYSASARLAWTLSYLYERGLADGRGDRRFNDDVSYRQHFLSTGPEFRFSDAMTVSLLYAYRLKEFTSELVGDTHFNRADHTHQGTAELSYAMNRASAVTLGYQRTQRDSTNQNREFHADLYSIGVRYTF